MRICTPVAATTDSLVLPEDAEVGADVKPLLQLDDWIFDIAITANRPDCESIFGIAREVAAILNKPVKTPALDYTERRYQGQFHRNCGCSGSVPQIYRTLCN